MGIVAIVGAVMALVAGFVVGWKPARKRPGGLAGTLDAEFRREFASVAAFGPQDLARLPFGFVPPPLRQGAAPADVAVAFHYRGREVLALRHTVYGTGPDGAPVTYPWTYVQVRASPTPRLRLLGSAAHQREPHQPDTTGMRQVHIGHQKFDDSLAVFTDDDGFARSLLTAPIVEYLTSDTRYHHKHISFERGVAWLRMPAQLTTDVACVGADTLIDLLDRSPLFAHVPAQPGGAPR
ncbi:hypothetical protein BJF85_23085 [Saccharomonospora sp. CUA-673]|nr:hypothetical protein BJF85_23085 [Saccharomonospora sp. CUA-673]